MVKKWDKHPGGRPRKELTGKITQEPANGVYYTVDEAAELLGVHVHTLHRRLNNGNLAGKKIGGIWRIYKAALYQAEGGRGE